MNRNCNQHSSNQQQTCFNYLIGRAVLTNNTHGGNHNHHSHTHNQSRQQQQSKYYMKSKTPQTAIYGSVTEIRTNNNFEDSEAHTEENNNNNENNEVNNENDNDDEDRAFKEIDDLYEYVRSGVLPEYLKSTHNNEAVYTTTINSRSKIASHTGLAPSSAANLTQEHSSPLQSHQLSSSQDHHHHNNNHKQHQSFYQTLNNHHHVQSQNVVSSVTAVTTAVSGGNGNGGNDETKDHSELFDVSTTTNTRKTYKINQKNSENVSGNSSFRNKKGKT